MLSFVILFHYPPPRPDLGVSKGMGTSLSKGAPQPAYAALFRSLDKNPHCEASGDLVTGNPKATQVE